jgi:two-component system, LytTR family, sensor kinase
LSSIQGLINKRNIEDANIYISKFGALLHDVLGKSDKTMQPLAIELRQIEYYLQLEQLRFKFQCKISVDANLNTSEINIPTMLLQPFVENAIKHGIVEKKEAGMIELSVRKHQSNLIIEINDNGKGYDINQPHTGRGNAMVAERIKALNEFLKDQQIELAIRSTENKGTAVSLHFSNWL